MSGYAITSWTWVLLASTAFMVAFGTYLWRRRETPGALPLSLAAFVLSLVCLASAGETAATDPIVRERWFVIGDYLAMPGAVLGLWFALAYAGLTRLLTRPVVALLVGSVVVLAPFYVIDGGHLVWSRLWWDGGVTGDVGPVGAVFGIYGFGLILLVTAVFLLLFARSPAHRVPVALILIGQASTRIAYPLSTLNIAHLPGVPLIALAFDLQMFLYGVALLRFGLFDVVPAARATIIERMPDVMLVLDSRGRIADLNGAAARLLQVARSRAIGRPLAALSGASTLAPLADDGADGEVELSFGEAAAARRYQVAITPLSDWQGRSIGRLVMLHDITALRTAEERLIEQERTVAGAKEREQVARELHDGVGQVLGYVSIQADAARKLMADRHVVAADGQLARLAEVAREAHADVRGYIAELHAAGAIPRPFLAALRQYVEGSALHYGVPTELAIDPALEDRGFRPDEQAQLLRIVQEAVANARRHANASCVRVELGLRDGRVRLVVEDDGRGFDIASATVPVEGDGRYGLLFMRERADEIGAGLTIDSAPGRGTRVIVDVPRETVPAVRQHGDTAPGEARPDGLAGATAGPPGAAVGPPGAAVGSSASAAVGASASAAVGSSASAAGRPDATGVGSR